MAGPLKRTGLRTSAEDAAFFRKFHHSALASLRQGLPREEVLRELLTRGVPEKTAERIVVAVEQEHAAKSQTPHQSPSGRRWVIGLATVLVFGCASVYIAMQMAEDKTLRMKYLLPAMIVVLLLSGIVIQRLLLKVRGPYDLPPPPDRHN